MSAFLMRTVDLSGGWSNLWSRLGQGSIQELLSMAAMVGVLLLVGALFLAIWKKKRGGGGGGTAMVWVMVAIGALLTAPNLLVPIVLNIIDLAVNTLARIFA